MPAEITQATIKELFYYDPETGILRNKTTRGPRALKGSICGNKDSNGYLKIKINRDCYVCHRIAFLHYYGWLPVEVDHKNGVRSDNRIDNLRASSPHQNQCNAKIRKDNKSGVKGVSWNKNLLKWVGVVTVMGKSHNVGRFDDLNEAAKKVNKARNQLHKEFSNDGYFNNKVE